MEAARPNPQPHPSLLAAPVEAGGISLILGAIGLRVYGEHAARGVPRKNYDETAPGGGLGIDRRGGGGSGGRMILDEEEMAALRSAARRQGHSRGSQDSGRGVRIQARATGAQAHPR